MIIFFTTLTNKKYLFFIGLFFLFGFTKKRTEKMEYKNDVSCFLLNRDTLIYKLTYYSFGEMRTIAGKALLIKKSSAIMTFKPIIYNDTINQRVVLGFENKKANINDSLLLYVVNEQDRSIGYVHMRFYYDMKEFLFYSDSLGRFKIIKPEKNLFLKFNYLGYKQTIVSANTLTQGSTIILSKGILIINETDKKFRISYKIKNDSLFYKFYEKDLWIGIPRRICN
jgi:hypothetical protein